MARGFTLIELLVVMGVIALLTLFSGVFVSASYGRSDLTADARTLVDALRRAQNQSIHGKGNSVWGVHLETAQLVLFKGASYSISDPNNVFYPLSGPVEITTITLNGGGSDITFTRPMGETTKDGTIVLSNTTSTATRTITINPVGTVDYD